MESSVIPGTTARGALLTYLYRLGRLTRADLERISRKGLVRFTPMLLEGAKVITSFSFELKLKGEYRLMKLETVKEVVRRALEENSLKPLCDLFPKEISKTIQGVYTEKKPNVRLSIQVAINKRERRAEEEMLFSYETVERGAKYEGYAIDFAKVLTEGEYEVHIGLGRSRGLGGALLLVEEISASERVEKLLKQVREASFEVLGKNFVILVARAPIVSLIGATRARPFIPKLGGSGWNAKIAKVKGKNLAFGKLRHIGGWSLLRGLPRPSIICADIGSLFVYEICGKDWDEGLARICAFGVDHLSSIGLNFLLPISSDEVVRRG